MPSPIKSIGLCRVSTSEQKTLGHSLERQGDNVKRASESLEAPIIRTWSIDQSSRTGKNLKRKDLNEMLEFCKDKKNGVKYLIIDEVDRFMRDIKYFYYFEATFEQLGVKVWYASQPELNSDDMMAKLQKLFLVFRAEASNDERTSKSLNGLKRRVQLGYYPFFTHHGYRKTETPGLHEPDPVKFPLLQKAVREVLSREYSPSEALKRLNDNGYTTRYGKSFKVDKFVKILKDPYYAGVIKIKNWDVQNKGLHQALVSWSEFEQLQEIISGRKLRPYKKKNPEFPLSQLMTCTECGGKLVGFNHSNGKGWRAPKYRCRNCGKQHKRDDVNTGLDTVLATIEFESVKKDKFIKALEIVWREKQITNINYISQLEKRLEELKDKKNRLIMVIANNPELEQDIKESIEGIKKDIIKTEGQINDAKNIEKDLVDFVSFALDFTQTLKMQWWKVNHNQRVKCKELLFPQGFSINYHEKVYTPQISPFYRFVSNKKEPDFASDSHLVELGRFALPSKKKLHNY